MSERRKLDGWKQIEKFLGVSHTTAWRLRKEEGLPVYRMGGSVVAYTDELEAWIRKGVPCHAEPSPSSS
jgi:predicted DNA-binding transcriptional regulator AlpA